jgi:hypothetical protein
MILRTVCFMIGGNVRKLRREWKVCMTFCLLQVCVFETSALQSSQFSRNKQKGLQLKGGSEVEMNLSHGCRKSQLCVVNAVLSAGGKVTGSIQSAAPLARRAGQDAHTHSPSPCAHEYTTGSQKVPGMVLLHLVGRTYCHAYRITLK